MGHIGGRVIEIRLDASRQMEALIACPVGMTPRAGQYLLAVDRDDPETVLGIPLFIAGESVHGWWAAPPIPASWKPGTSLDLVGPLGKGFDLPREVQRLGLAALGDSVGRLMPVIRQTGLVQRAVTLFTDLPLPSLPAFVEAYPLATLPEALEWPDFMQIDLPLRRLAELRAILGIQGGKELAFPAQVLITTPMPCAGLARCGACAVPTQRGWKFACEDGPVFDLKALKW